MVESVDGVGELLEDLKKHTFEKYNAFTVAEVFNMKKDELREFIGDHGHFSTMFDFSAHSLFFNDYTSCEYKELDIRQLKQAMFHSQLEWRMLDSWLILLRIMMNQGAQADICPSIFRMKME